MTIVSEAVQPDCREFCWEPPGDEPLRVRGLDGDGEPEILVDIHTRGAHCCSMLLLYGFDAASGRRVTIDRDFGNPGFTLRDLGRDGRAEIRRHASDLCSFYKRLRREPDLDVRGVLAAWQADNYLLGGSAP